KHIWHCCNGCGSASRDDLPDYESTFSFKFSYKTLKKHKPPMATSIGRNEAVADDPSRLFDYMASDRHVQLHKEQHKIFDTFKKDILERYNLDVRGRSVLDISGGNGSFAKELQGLGASVAMTEFNQKSVEFAREKFHIDSRRFDFNSDDIGELFSDLKFDFVLLRFAVMFCRDIGKFIDSLRPILNPGAIVVVNGSTEPTLGTMLRFQYDDYAYLVLYNSKALDERFAVKGYSRIGTHIILGAKRSYSWDMHPKVKRLDFWLYRVPAFFKWKNRDTHIRTNVMLYRLND
ncbi:MAG TPA: class I SAM-dependent methyltransferase, partial [Bacteroidia bacterium]